MSFRTLLFGAMFVLAAPLAAMLAMAAPSGAQDVLTYTVDLNDRADDHFKVSLAVEGLTDANAVYQFASTAPGTYQVMDMGRFVREFEAIDADGNALPSERISTNQWRVEGVERAREIRYAIAETWDTPVDEHAIYMMAGTSLEEDHALINAHAVIGYPAGHQATPIRLFLEYPAGWEVGTALDLDAEGAYRADDYDHLVDSPILMGRLSKASLDVTGVPVEIYTYSKTDVITSDQLLEAMREMLESAGEFLGRLPVDRYTFLYHFENVTQGAWEHSYSSEYVFQEFPQWSPRIGVFLTDIAAHEFFHVVTPLNIHSEIIEHFNFVEPVASEHLWLYEGTTEWASDAMQLRSGLKDTDAYFAALIEKMQIDARFEADFSLSELSLTSYSDHGQSQYGNIYNRGALVAGLLDIRLLELSGGTRGLRDLVMDLSERFGKERAFPEDGLFALIEEMTFPEVGEFFGSYIKNAEPLPIKEYYDKLGIRLVDDENGNPVRFEMNPDATAAQLKLRAAWLAIRPSA